jgi:hypothetical protein
LPDRSRDELLFGAPGKEGAHGGTLGSPVMNEWGYSCRLVDLMGKLL